MSLEFLTVRPSTGEILAELPGAIADGSITTGLGFAEDFSISLPVTDRLSPFWMAATEPGMMLVCNDARNNVPLIGGIITNRSYGSTSSIKVGATSVENWLNRVTVPNGEVRKELTDLVEYLGLGLLAQHFHGAVVKYSTNIHATRTYEADQATKRLDALHALMRTEPVEWVIRYSWDATGRLVPTGVASSKIGRDSEFVFGGNTEWSVTVDYSDGNGANIVTASGNRDTVIVTEEGEEQGQEFISHTAKDQELLDAGVPPIEYSFQPESSSTSTDVLTRAAHQRLLEMRRGTKTTTMKTLLENVQIGVDVQPGDYVQVDLTNPNLAGVDETYELRMIGYTLETASNEITYISPILMEDSPVYSSSGGS